MSSELAGELEFGLATGTVGEAAKVRPARNTSLDDEFCSVDWDDISETPRWRTYAWMAGGLALIIGGIFVGMVILTNMEPEPPGSRLAAPAMVQK